MIGVASSTALGVSITGIWEPGARWGRHRRTGVVARWTPCCGGWIREDTVLGMVTEHVSRRRLSWLSPHEVALMELGR